MSKTVEEKKTEALARMAQLGIFPETIRQFKDDGYISISEPPVGAFYWAEGEDLQRIREFEAQHNAVVYVVVRARVNGDKMDAYLFVSDYDEEWAMDWEDLKHMEPLAWVYNHDAPWCSEFGHIGVERSVAAGLLRTC